MIPRDLGIDRHNSCERIHTTRVKSWIESDGRMSSLSSSCSLCLFLGLGMNIDCQGSNAESNLEKQVCLDSRVIFSCIDFLASDPSFRDSCFLCVNKAYMCLPFIFVRITRHETLHCHMTRVEEEFEQVIQVHFSQFWSSLFLYRFPHFYPNFLFILTRESLGNQKVLFLFLEFALNTSRSLGLVNPFHLRF